MWEHTRGCHHCQGQLWTVGWKVSNLFVSKRFQLCYISRRLYRPWNKKNRPCTMPSKWRGCEDLLSDPSPIFVHIFHWLTWLTRWPCSDLIDSHWWGYLIGDGWILARFWSWIMVNIREDLNRKKTFSFGHCPNHLTPPPTPIWATWSSFLDVKTDVCAYDRIFFLWW